MISTRFRSSLFGVALLVLSTGCGGSSSPSPTAPTPTVTPAVRPTPTGGSFLAVNSRPGDGILNGTSRTLTPADGSFTVKVDPTEVVVELLAHGNSYWSLFLGASPGAPLAPGTYDQPEPTSRHLRSGPYLSFGGNGYSCSAIGRFTVHAIEYTGPNALSRLHATFELRCPSAAQPLSGEVWIGDDFSAEAAATSIAGTWSGRLETWYGWGPAEVRLQQSGQIVTGTWSASSFRWSGQVEGRVTLGGFSGTMTLAGLVGASATPCDTRAPVTAFVRDGLTELALSPGRFEGACEGHLVGTRLVMQTRR